MTDSKARNASEEISGAIEEASREASNVRSVQHSIESLLKGVLEQSPPPERIQSTIDVILEEDILSDKK